MKAVRSKKISSKKQDTCCVFQHPIEIGKIFTFANKDVFCLPNSKRPRKSIEKQYVASDGVFHRNYMPTTSKIKVRLAFVSFDVTIRLQDVLNVSWQSVL